MTRPSGQALTAGAVAEALKALSAIVESQDANFVGHAARVADLAAAIAVTMGLGDDEVQDLRTAGRLHDVGMLLIPADVLRKTTPLSADETLLIRYHPIVGATIAASLVNQTIQSCIRGHHERWDGTGYPDQLAQSAIPLGARILAVSEIFDALTSERPYRSRMTVEGALARIRELKGTAVDPGVAAAIAATVEARRGLVFFAGDHPFGLETEGTETDREPDAVEAPAKSPGEWTGPTLESL